MPVENNVLLIASCGLYCGACGAYKKGKCPGCAKNEKATWCGVRKCCIQKSIANCAACTEFSDKRACKTLNNSISKLIGFFVGSDRPGCIEKISELGPDKYAEYMSENGIQSIKKR